MALAILVSILLLGGALFSLLASVGLLRLPDLFTRMQATSKSSTLGVGAAVLGAALYLQEGGAWTQSLATIAFVFFTAPVGAHVIARAAYMARVALWDGTLTDEMAGGTTEEHPKV